MLLVVLATSRGQNESRDKFNKLLKDFGFSVSIDAGEGDEGGEGGEGGEGSGGRGGR